MSISVMLERSQRHIQLDQLRTIELHGITLTHSPLQSFFNVLVFKASLEESHGSLSVDAVAEMYDKNVKFANPEDAVT